ncbi:MAG: RNA-directed DNA polymerase [Bacilli bacterium]|nr:RNA-directed DNA polymerase [Bacilli bacterium]
MKKKQINLSYESILDPSKIIYVYNKIKKKTKYKHKLIKYDMFLSCNISYIIETLKNREYKHNYYNVFLITKPKPRIIMSENLHDKIINHLFSEYILLPLIEPKLICANVATRKDKGTKMGIYYMKKYLNIMKQKYNNFYILKCDIKKFFYSIDHRILLNKLNKYIKDKDVLNILEEIINSTNHEYINNNIQKIKDRFIKDIKYKNITLKEKEMLIKSISSIPNYSYNKGLPIGNVSSQIFAIFYLNDLDHFIKEKLKIKYYIRYMDDFVLFHYDKNYLKYCYGEINKFVKGEELVINKKTQIIPIKNGINFLGYRFLINNNKVYITMSSYNKRKIKKCNAISNYGGYIKYLSKNKFYLNKRCYN